MKNYFLLYVVRICESIRLTNIIMFGNGPYDPEFVQFYTHKNYIYKKLNYLIFSTKR